MHPHKNRSFAVIYVPFYKLQCAWQDHLLRGKCNESSANNLGVIALVQSTRAPAIEIDDLCSEYAVGLLESDGLHVSEVNPVALAAGIRPGSTTGLATARAPAILLLGAKPAREEQLQQTLLQIAYRFSPYLEMTAPGVCTLDLRAKKAAPHQPWLQDFLAQLRQLGFKAQAGIGRNPEIALQAAKIADPIREIFGDSLQPLPLESLSPSPYLLDILQNWGIRTLGDLTRLPREDVGQRLGLEGLSLWDRAAGRFRNALHYVQPPETFVESIEFDYRLETLETLLFVLRRFLERLSLRVEAVYRLIAELRLQISLEDGKKIVRHLQIPAPTREAETLLRICGQYLETVQTSAPIVAFLVEALPSPPEHHQFDLFQGGLKDPNRFFQTLARLAALVGNDQVGVPRQNDTYQPDCFQLKLPDFSWSSSIAPTAASPVRTFTASPARTFRIGPALRRYRPALAARIQVHQGKPAALQSRTISGKIRESAGPWKLSGHWWDRAGWRTEEWDIKLDQGGIYRVAQTADHWEIVGEYD